MPSTFIVRPSASHAPMHTVRSRISASVYSRVQPSEEVVVEVAVVEREPFGVLDGQPFPLGVTGIRAPLGDVGEVVFGQRLGRARGLAPLLADRAVVDLGDAHPRQLALAHREDALLVHRVAQRARADAHLGPQLPHANFGIALAVGDLDARHHWLACSYQLSMPRRAVGFVHAMRRISASVSPSANSASA